MDKCPKCGNKLSPVDVLCPRCGALVEVIHVASHPDAVPSENADVNMSRKQRPADTAPQNDTSISRQDEPLEEAVMPWQTNTADLHEEDDMPMSRKARKAALPSEKDDAPISPEALAYSVEEMPASRQTPEAAAEESDLPMSRQARKAALRAKNNRGAQPAMPLELTDVEKGSTRRWLEIEDVDPELNTIKDEPEQLTRSETEIQKNPGYDTADDSGMSDTQTPESLTDNELIDDTPRRFRTYPVDEAESQPVKKVRRSPIALIVLMWVVIAVAVFGALYFVDTQVVSAYGGWDDFVRQITSGKVELDTGTSYVNSINVDLNETQTEDGAPAHRFDITMNGGKSIKVLPLSDTFDMEDGFVSFTIADELMAQKLGAMTSNPTIDVDNLSLEVTTASQTFIYPITAFTLTLTDAVYTREAPSPAEMTSSDDVLQLAMTVSPDATVFINNTSYADDIDENGRLSVSMPLDIGENLFVIEVIQPGRRTVQESFTITREEIKTSLTPSEESMRVSSSSFECTGTTDAGASLTATLNGSTYKALISEDGKFSIVCSLEVYGMYDLVIKAESENHSDAEATIKVEYVPEQQAFMDDAHTYTVSKMIKDIDSLDDTAVKVEGKAESISAEGDKQKFVLTSGEDTLNCYYFGSTKLSPDTTYTFYGIADAEATSFYVIFME